MKPLKELVELAKKKEKKKVVVACCQDKEVLLAFEKARKLGLETEKSFLMEKLPS